jgi:uncharacterized protein (DUF1778 family)
MPAKTTQRRGVTITVRVSQRQKALIDQAARSLGLTCSAFVLESACREAQAVLLDQLYFVLPKMRFKRLTAMLDKPPARNRRLARLLKTRAPWDRSSS